MKQKYFQRQFDVRGYECDFKGRLHPLSLFNFMQELASTHADQLGFSVQKLMQQKMTWVLSRLHLKINKPILWSEILTGRTWPSGRSGKYALRDFQFFNKADETIAVGTSSWMVIDLEKRQPLKLDQIFTSDVSLEKRALEDDFPALPEISKSENECKFAVRFSDLDLNRHVNHVSYIAWALESIPQAILFRHFPMEVEVSYRKEIFLGDQVICKLQSIPGTDSLSYIHQLYLEKNEQEIARLRTQWK
jgi:acyl-ACP thioesterase